jgi:nucleobase:cation symporter-1, NCS1 family
VAAFIPAAMLALIVNFLPVFSKVAPFTWFVGVSAAALIYYAISRGRITPAHEDAGR